MRTRDARRIREGIMFGREWSRCMKETRGADLLMDYLDVWSRTHSKAANTAAARTMRVVRQGWTNTSR